MDDTGDSKNTRPGDCYLLEDRPARRNDGEILPALTVY